MKRAIRKNMIGRPVDTICGHVRGKNASGGDAWDRPFLYLVEDDDAYVVDELQDRLSLMIGNGHACTPVAQF